MKRIYAIVKVRPKMRSWDVIKAFENYDKSLRHRDELQEQAKLNDSAVIYLVQSLELEEENENESI